MLSTSVPHSTTLNSLRMETLEKLPVGSLNNIAERVRSALLQAFLPKLCNDCQPRFTDAFNASQATAHLLKNLCNTCKIAYIKDRKASTLKTCVVPKKRAPSPQPESTKFGAMCRSAVTKTTRDVATEPNLPQELQPCHVIVIPKKIKLSAIDPALTLPLTPPPDVIGVSGEQNTSCHTEAQMQPLPAPLDDSFPIYTALEHLNLPWCRYCGVAGGGGWKLGPWGEHTLCHKHGCEFLGFGFARASNSRLNLSEYRHEGRAGRLHPVIQDFCSACRPLEKDSTGGLIKCHGCPKAFHPHCLKDSGATINGHWHCSEACNGNFTTRHIKPPIKTSHLPHKMSVYSTEEVMTLLRFKQIRLVFPSHSPTHPSLSVSQLKKKLRKQKRRNQCMLDQVVAFVPVKVDPSVHVHAHIDTPRWTLKSLEERTGYESLPMEPDYFDEELDDTLLLARHSRYEHVEVHFRLLTPGILEKLNAGETVELPPHH